MKSKKGLQVNKTIRKSKYREGGLKLKIEFFDIFKIKVKINKIELFICFLNINIFQH